MSTLETPWLQICVATGIGLLVGLEREHRKGDGPRRIPAGIRTFTVVSLLGAAAQLSGGWPLLAAAAIAVGVMAVVAYGRSRAADPGFTTGVALILVLVLGGMAMSRPAVAAGFATVLAVLLASRERLHRFVQRGLSTQEVEDFLALAAATLVVLPMIPAGTIGPWDALSPRTAWIVVILTMLIGALGHVAKRLFGAGLGLALAGLASGFVSSAATIGAMGHRARREPSLRRAAVAGAVMSTVATVVQMAIVLAATSMETLRVMAGPLLAAGLAAGGYAILFTWRSLKAPDAAHDLQGRAFSLPQALGLAALLSAVMVLVAALQATLGDRGVLIAAAAAGFADTHSAAVSVATLVAAGKLPAAEAPTGILLALTTNTVTKMVAAASAGGRAFALDVVPGLAAVIGAAWLAHGLVGRV